MEKPERKERSEKEIKEAKARKKMGRPKGLGDGYDVHFNMRISQGHMDMIDAMIGKREMSRAECMRTLIKENYLRLDQAGMIKREG